MQKEDLLSKSPAELDQLFTLGAPAPIPSGNAAGEVVLWKGGTFLERCIAWWAHELVWQGKIFTPNPDGDGATLINKLGPTGVHAIVARVYTTTSWFDAKPCIVLDYSKTSLLAQKIRDEIRLVDPATRLYLGKVWWGTRELIGFALEFPAQG
jgi:hypothetical protein